MRLDIGRVVEEGARRTLERNGLMLVAALFLINLAGSFLGLGSATAAGTPGYQMFGLSGNPVAMMVVGIVLSLVSVVVSIAALRVFVTQETATIPDAAFKRNIGYVLVHTLVGGLVFGILVAIGLILLVIPGVYLLLALFFWTMYVAVEDQNFYEALQSSWELTKGHKWRLLGLLLVIGIVNVVLSAVGGLMSLAGPEVVGVILLQAFSAFGGVFALAAQARAYTQLSA